MSAFAFAIDVLFEDPNMGVDAVYRAGGDSVGVPVRVMRRAPDRLANFGEGRFVTDTVFIDVRCAEVAALSAGDTFEIDSVVYEVRSEPVRDSERLVWASEVREL
jgi:hypothetical protein